MKGSILAKALILSAAVCVVVGGTMAFAVFHHDDGDNRIAFVLTNHEGQLTTQETLSGEHLLVFFGFTSCHKICPTQMTKLTSAMANLHESGYGSRVTPVFISVDPERDSVEKVATYLDAFHRDFIGLTGSRVALTSAAKRFQIFLDEAPSDPQDGYQLTHTSVVYLVDPHGRLVDYMPLSAGAAEIADQVRNTLLTNDGRLSITARNITQ